ncbi:hypothetical protein [Citrobacter sp. RHBSTW-00229]|uniref:hypothetical protein n=1 Tax=Citrobacter sp. RHBSTW-00229 TaxID=2742641 RepID=UPI002017275B|nr:hypothetical protein [Citrobacter sp. RHBSTW-00229]
MYHVDNSTGIPVMPQPSPVTSETELFFTEGGNGVPPTYPGPDWFNTIQSELLNILRSAGLDPDKMDNTQILAALKKLFLSRSNPFGDIKADGAAAIATALSNLQLQETVKEAAGSLQKGNNFSDVENIVAARLNLQLGDSAILNVGKVYGSVASGDSTFGIAQQYKDVTSSRVLGVTYTNTTSRAIMILVTLDVPLNGRRDAVVGGVITSSFASSNSASQIGTVYAVVPPGVTYSIAASIIPGGSLIRWMELSQ